MDSFFMCTQTATNKDIVLNADEWLVANIDMKGFYRVNYDSDNWERLLAKLSSKHVVTSLHLEMTRLHPQGS